MMDDYSCGIRYVISHPSLLSFSRLKFAVLDKLIQRIPRAHPELHLASFVKTQSAPILRLPRQLPLHHLLYSLMLPLQPSLLSLPVPYLSALCVTPSRRCSRHATSEGPAAGMLRLRRASARVSCCLRPSPV